MPEAYPPADPTHLHPMILTTEELIELTDRRQAAAQIRWLRDRGWKFEVGGNGRPKVLRAEAERRMLSGSVAGGKMRTKELNLAKVA